MSGGATKAARAVGTAVLAIVSVLVGFLLLAFGARAVAVPWLRWIDLWVADGDERRVVLAVVAWSWALGLLVVGVRAARRRWGRAASAGWLLVAAAALPVFAFVPGRSSGDNGASTVTREALGPLAQVGGPLAVVAFVTFLSVVGLAVAVVRPRPGDPPRTRWLRRPLGTVVAWSLVAAVLAGAMAAYVDATPTRGSWLDQTARAVAGGDEGVTGGFEIGLDTRRAEVVPCEEAAGLLSVEGEAPALEGCRSALVVDAVGRTGEGASRRDTGALGAVVVQTRTLDQLDALDRALDGAELVGDLAPDSAEPVLVSPAARSYALVIAAEDPGDAPLGEGAAQRPLTRALAYTVIGTAVGLYLGPPETGGGPGDGL